MKASWTPVAPSRRFSSRWIFAPAEAQYRDLLARQQEEEELEAEQEWADTFPLKEMAEHGFIAQDAGLGDLLRFLGVSSVDAYMTYWSSPRRVRCCRCRRGIRP
jgi:hypothetical protein